MPRKWTARKQTTLDETAIDTAKFARAYPVFRADPEPAIAHRQALRLLATYTFLWLPIHCGICWLVSYSLGLAVALVTVSAAAAFAVAFAKWLALEDLLQKLPLLLVLGLVFAGLAFFTSQPNPRWLGGAEFFGTFLILIMLVSVLSGLYRPMAVAYQTVTLKTPLRDLCVGAVAMLVSLGLAALAHVLPKFGFTLLASAILGGYAGLVVLEYAGWARANPNLSLERAKAFAKPAVVPGQTAAAKDNENDSYGAFYGAILCGLGYGLLTVFHQNLSSPSPGLHRLLRSLTEKEPEKVPEVFAMMMLLGLYAVLFGLYKVASALHALKPANPLLGSRLAWNALVVFLTYPEAKHPLVHKFRMYWLRPVSVRMAVTGLALLTVATAFFAAEKLPSTDQEAKSAAKTLQPPPQPASPQFVRAGGAEAKGIFGLSPDESYDRPFSLPPTQTPPPPADQPPSVSGVPRFALNAVALVVGPLAFLYAMIWFVGLTVLPTYFNYFEKPQVPSPPA